MERFIRSKSFFIRDGLPLTQSALAKIGREIALLAAWPRELASKSMRARLVDAVRGPTAFLYGLLLFPVLPIVLYGTRQRLRGFIPSPSLKMTILIG